MEQWKLDGGLLLIDKPLEWTSFDVVKKLRNVLRYKKIGHAGTLDPLATGLLIVCFGRFTKRIEEIQSQGKTYIAELELGKTTPSFDRETDVDQVRSIKGLGTDEIESALQAFRGEITQFPPKYSAVKIDGKRAYDYARQGQDVKLRPRQVTISSLHIVSYDAPILKLEMQCSKGTYVRSLARDLGQALNCGAHLTALRRTQIGSFNVEDALLPEDFSSEEDFYLQRITSF